MPFPIGLIEGASAIGLSRSGRAVENARRVFFEAQNLTDEPMRQYQAGNPDWLIQNERYGRTFYAGISAKFRCALPFFLRSC